MKKPSSLHWCGGNPTPTPIPEIEQTVLMWSHFMTMDGGHPFAGTAITCSYHISKKYMSLSRFSFSRLIQIRWFYYKKWGIYSVTHMPFHLFFEEQENWAFFISRRSIAVDHQKRWSFGSMMPLWNGRRTFPLDPDQILQTLCFLWWRTLFWKNWSIYETQNSLRHWLVPRGQFMDADFKHNWAWCFLATSTWLSIGWIFSTQPWIYSQA